VVEAVAELVQLVEPEVETSRIRIASQLTKVLHPDKHLVAFCRRRTFVLRYLFERERPG
jgi:hypothetical protein